MRIKLILIQTKALSFKLNQIDLHSMMRNSKRKTYYSLFRKGKISLLSYLNASVSQNLNPSMSAQHLHITSVIVF